MMSEEEGREMVDVETVEALVVEGVMVGSGDHADYAHRPHRPHLPAEEEDDGAKLTRKEKSLGLLCKKFLDHMREETEKGTKIHLESTAASLGVEKRRIYDIVNVMEAMDAMSKHTKSYYVWNGLDHIPRLMAELRAIAKAEGLPERIRDVERAMCNLAGVGSEPIAPVWPDDATCAQLSPELLATRDRGARNSLSLLCRRFLMVLLCSPTENRVSLDVASTVLIKDPYTDGFEPPSRSRCRRLYDIANVLVAMGIIEKVFYLFGTKKIPLFQYCGPAPDMNGPPVPIVERVPRHSVDWSDGKILTGLNVNKNKKAERASWDGPGSSGVSLERRSSLLDMCEVAAAERERLRRESGGPVPTLSKTSSELEMEEAGAALRAVLDGTSDDDEANKENEAPARRRLDPATLLRNQLQPMLSPSAAFFAAQQARAQHPRLLLQQYQLLQQRTAAGLGSANILRPVPLKARRMDDSTSGLLPIRSLPASKPSGSSTPPKANTRVITIKRPWLASPKSKPNRTNVLVRVMGGSFYTPAPTTERSPKPKLATSPPSASSTNSPGPLDLSKLGPASYRITGSGALKRRLPLSPIKNTMRSSHAGGTGSIGGLLSPNLLPLNMRPL